MSLRSDSPILSSEAFSAQLNQGLPLYISSQVVVDNPKLALLLEDLTQRLTPTAVQTTKQQELKNAAAALKEARRGYLEKATLLHYTQSAVRAPSAPKMLRQVEDAIALSELGSSLQLMPDLGKSNDESDKQSLSVNSSNSDNSKDISKTSDDHHFSKNSTFNSSVSSTASNCLASSLDASSCDSSTASKPSTAALAVALKNRPRTMRDPLVHHFASRPALRERASRLTASPQVAAVLLDAAGRRILEAWSTVVPCITPTDQDCTRWTGPQVLQHITRLCDTTSASRRALGRYSALTHALVLQVDSQLVEYGECIANLVKKRRLSQQPLHHLMYLSTTLHALYHKLRCVELQILCSTYSPEALTALRALHSQINQRLNAASTKLTSLQHKLEPYKHLDPTYLALLDEHKKLKSDIEFCKGSRLSN